MKTAKKKINETVKLFGVEKATLGQRTIDYYISVPGRQNEYAFSSRYSDSAYALCKSGIRYNALTTLRCRNTSVMKLKSQALRMEKYLAESLELPMSRVGRPQTADLIVA